MNVIENTGADLPIVQIRDPQIIIDNLSDLWLLSSKRAVILKPQPVISLFWSPVSLHQGDVIGITNLFVFQGNPPFKQSSHLLLPKSRFCRNRWQYLYSDWHNNCCDRWRQQSYECAAVVSVVGLRGRALAQEFRSVWRREHQFQFKSNIWVKTAFRYKMLNLEKHYFYDYVKIEK